MVAQQQESKNFEGQCQGQGENFTVPSNFLYDQKRISHSKTILNFE